MNPDDLLFAQLRDCFTAGYTMPQFCRDNEIQAPLFVVTDTENWQMLWEIFAQFAQEKITTPTFSAINRGLQSVKLSPGTIFDAMEIKNFAEINPAAFDKIFLLSTKFKANADNAIYLNELVEKFVQRAYLEIPMLNFLQGHPKIKLFLTNFTLVARSPKNTDWENQIIAEMKPLSKIKAELAEDNSGRVKTPYDFLGYSRQQLIDILSLSTTKTNPDGSTTLEDNPNPLVQIENGRRRVANQPETFVNRIYFMGGCSHLGVGAPFDKTIPSYLQTFLTENNLPYRVENVSQFFTYRYQDIFFNLENLPLKPDDIVFVFFDNMLSKIIPSFDVSRVFLRPHNFGEVFVDNCHVNELGYKALAERFFIFLVKNKFFRGVDFKYPAPPPPPHRYGFHAENLLANPELEAYKKNLRDRRLKIGAIVMNCNPFTLGHEYLIDFAAKKVAKLYIFVVEEDRSEFTFAERFQLVEAGAKKFPNVEVIPSGKFIISQQTFSGYFNKAELQNVSVDSSLDVEIFAREIAPTLGINIRFAGEEPEDAVTRQYNETMKKILPRYGIDFCEIPRREIAGEIISAKAVRDALKLGDFNKIRKLVPKSTLKFLREKYPQN